MNFKRFALLTVLSLVFILPAETVSAQEAGQTHSVQQGETLFSIARQYDVTVGDLRRWNQLQTDDLSTGQEIKVGPPVREDALIHTVSQGETMFAISRMYNVTIAELQAWNGMDDVHLEIGRELVIYTEQHGESFEAEESDEITAPPSPEQIDRESIVRARGESPNTYYTVRSGDTLNRIAREHNMSLAELRELNDLQGDLISIGQVLTVRDIQSAPSVAETAEESTPQGKFATYRVEQGDTFDSLLDNFRLTENQLIALNPGFNFDNLASGQRITVLLPTTRIFKNPYKKRAALEDLGKVPVTVYGDDEFSKPTTSGELYSPDELTAAHANMALGNIVYIENPNSGAGIYVRINDRYSGSGLKLSERAFGMLNFSSVDNAEVAIYLDQ